MLWVYEHYNFLIPAVSSTDVRLYILPCNIQIESTALSYSWLLSIEWWRKCQNIKLYQKIKKIKKIKKTSKTFKKSFNSIMMSALYSLIQKPQSRH